MHECLSASRSRAPLRAMAGLKKPRPWRPGWLSIHIPFSQWKLTLPKKPFLITSLRCTLGVEATSFCLSLGSSTHHLQAQLLIDICVTDFTQPSCELFLAQSALIFQIDSLKWSWAFYCIHYMHKLCLTRQTVVVMQTRIVSMQEFLLTFQF